MRHVISVLMQNEVGALTRLTGMFSTRGYNIESLNVAPTDDPTLSRLTVVSSGSDAVIAQIVNQMGKLIDVVNIHDMTLGEHFERELLLLKLKIPTGAYEELRGVVDAAGARVLDDSQNSFTLELTATVKEVQDFMDRSAGIARIIAVVRSGALAMSRGEQVLAHESGLRDSA
ncbi:acetolactate synthase small subunit [Lentisalinibacter salinarum]|uniref:acetolactate synthase small subunit n=1 Tax=Lentisalinibacter salinarum TaxID=2992239 RepID=UPI00386E6B1F